MNADLNTLIVGTLVDGSTLALISVGFVVIFRTTKVVSFAQGVFMVVGALISAELVNRGLNAYISLVAAALAAGVLGALLFRLVFLRLLGISPFATAIATISVGILGLAVCELIRGSGTIVVGRQVLSFHSIPVAGLKLNQVVIFSVVLAGVVYCIIGATMRWTRVGLYMRAVADRPVLAGYVRIPTAAISALAWGAGAFAAALSGGSFVLVNQPTPDTVFGLGLVAFPALLLGGLDSVLGALVGSLAIAALQNATLLALGGSWQDVVSYGALLVVLLVRPQGLFGSAEVSRL